MSNGKPSDLEYAGDSVLIENPGQFQIFFDVLGGSVFMFGRVFASSRYKVL